MNRGRCKRRWRGQAEVPTCLQRGGKTGVAQQCIVCRACPFVVHETSSIAAAKNCPAFSGRDRIQETILKRRRPGKANNRREVVFVRAEEVIAVTIHTEKVVGAVRVEDRSPGISTEHGL